ncbi:AAA family ATPase [Candidatus Binatia bacterium]|nr:AAA family ATPase [Candidatus Binatia bacterium]
MISFGDFRLDRRTRRLRHRGSERPLRAKSSAVLLHLAEHPDRLVTHDELLRAAWPDTAVSQTVLRVCIREIRAALGEDADRFLTTVPRRGYRFSLDGGDGGGSAAVFVGRETERAALHEALARARSGHRQVVLVAGDAGAGKTALLDHFLDEIRADGGVRCARGQALELQGAVQGCTAVLDLLSRLCDEVGGDDVVRVLARRAPGWLLQLAGRIDDATADALRARVSNSSWEGRLLELGEAMESLASQKPLVLVLEDLHWSDASTIDALAYLTRRTVAARLLVIGTYRAGALLDGRPFLSTLQRLRAGGPAVAIELGPLSIAEIESYLEQRLAPQPLADHVAGALSDASEGHALSLVEVVEHLLEQRRLQLRDGVWQLDGTPPKRSSNAVGRRVEPMPSADAGDDVADVAIAAERRQLTVMSCDLVGATDLAQRLDPEDLRSVVRAFQETASAMIRRYEGHVAQYLIDGLLAYFCYPQAHEDDAERAVRAGLDLLTGLDALNATLERDHRVRLATRIGIHTGPVVIGEMGSGASSGMIALGDVPHNAVRVRDAAAPDTVCITPATQRLVAGTFVIEDRGAQALEGLREPLDLYRVVRMSGVRGRLATATGRLTPFVGRDAELSTLRERWERVRRGAGQSVVVIGEAGVGKSRLAIQLRQHLTDFPHTWLESGATPFTAGTPFHPVIALLSQGLGFAAGDTTAEKLAKTERGLGRLATPETVALVADLVGLPAPTRLQLSPELQRRKTIELLLQWTLAIGDAQPTVLVIEDLHWCDPSSLELLEYVVARISAARLLVLLTARPEFVPPWPAGEQATTLELARLGERETRDIVRTLGADALPASTVDALVVRSDGVPLYVEELVKSVVEPGGTHGVAAIPATLADSLMGRLDRLAAAKEVAQRAAVLGREFAHPLLAAVSGLDEAVLRHEMARLVEAEIVFVRGEPPDATYAFKHALIQETAYQSLLKGTRQQLHARIGQLLEERFPERVAAEPEVVARHYEHAGLVERAIEHYRRAGERAAERSANEESIGHLRRALELVATLPETRDRDQRELQLQMAIAAPLGAARGFSDPESEGAFARARELASRIVGSPELPRVLMGLATAHFVKGDLASGDAVGREALAAAERTGDPLDLLLGHVVVGFPFFYRGQFSRALQHYAKATALYDPTQHASFARTLGWDRGVNAHAYLAWCHLYLGNHDRAREWSDEAVALARRVDHPLTLANVLLHAAILHIERREPERALVLSAELIAVAEPLGFPMFAGAGRFFRGCARADSGEGAEGIAAMERALGELARTGTGIGAPGFLTLFADRLRGVGRYDDALGVVALGLARADSQDAHWVDSELHRLHARILIEQGDPAHEAEAHLVRALEIARRHENRLHGLRVAMDLARLWQSRRRRAACRALLGPIHAGFSEGFDLQDLKDARALLDAVE